MFQTPSPDKAAFGTLEKIPFLLCVLPGSGKSLELTSLDNLRSAGLQEEIDMDLFVYLTQMFSKKIFFLTVNPDAVPEQVAFYNALAGFFRKNIV